MQEGADVGAHVHLSRVLGHVGGQRNVQRGLRSRAVKAGRHAGRPQLHVISRQDLYEEHTPVTASASNSLYGT